MREVEDVVRSRALALLRRHGREATSFQILEPGLSYWFDGAEGVVAYTDTGRAWVTAGEPVAAPERKSACIEGFCIAACAAGRRVRFFHVSAPFAEHGELAHTHVGELPVWDATHWARTLQGARSLREQLRRARAKGVRARIVPSAEIATPGSPLRDACGVLIERWLGGRRLGELKFMVRLAPYHYAEERRYAVAERDGRVIGLAVAIPVYARGGWFIEDLLRDPDAVNGTAELLIDALFKRFADEGASYVTLGLAPLSGEVSRLLSFTRDHTARLYNFPGVRSFKEKLKPARWEPVYVAYPRGELGLVAMRDVLAAFAPAGVVRFGLETLVRATHAHVRLRFLSQKHPTRA